MIRTAISKATLLGFLWVMTSAAVAIQAATTELTGDFSSMSVGTVRPIRVQVRNSVYRNTVDVAYVKATSMGNLTEGVGFSYYLTGGIFENEFLVQVQLDAFGNGFSDVFYLKALSPVAPVELTACTSWQSGGCGAVSLGTSSGVTPPPPNPNPPPSVSAIGVGEVVAFWLITPQQIAPEFRGYTVTFAIQPSERIGAAANANSSTWLGSFGVDMYIDSNGYGRSETFYLKGRKKTSSTEYISASSDNHFIAQSQNIPIKVVQVTTVNWVPYRSTHPLDENPNFGGGARHFADKNTVDESPDTEWRQIGLKVQTSPATAGMNVRVKVFDVDDPSTDMDVDANGLAGNDNRESLGTLVADLTTDSNGNAFVYMRASSRPGDNYRAAAMVASRPLPASDPLRQRFDAITTSPSYGFVLWEDGYELPVWGPSQALGPHEEFLSGPMLTVWRRLHIEHDSMGQVRHNRATGSFLRTQRFKPATQTILDLDTSSARLESHRYENGRLVFKETMTSTPRVFKVLWNTESQVQVEGDIASANFSTDTFTLYDDDDFNNNDGASPDGDDGEEIPSIFSDLVRDSDSPLLNTLAPAYICPKYDMPGNQSDLAFKLNETVTTANFDNLAHVGDQNFWLLYFINTYQTGGRANGDPDSVGAEGGLRFGGIGVGFYLEGYRELERREIAAGRTIPPHATMKRWLAQEIGFLLDTDHSDGGMAANPYDCTSGCTSFTTKSQAKMRSVLLPVNFLN